MPFTSFPEDLYNVLIPELTWLTPPVYVAIPFLSVTIPDLNSGILLFNVSSPSAKSLEPSCNFPAASSISSTFSSKSDKSISLMSNPSLHKATVIVISRLKFSTSAVIST